jgi:signal transduction histidine kinase
VPADVAASWHILRKWIGGYTGHDTAALQTLDVYPFLLQAAEKARHRASHRAVDVAVEGLNDIYIVIDPAILREVIDGLLRNAIENTPDYGSVTIAAEETADIVTIRVTDTGVGVTEENQQYIFDGLFHAKETEIYASKQAYDFGAGGKGLDLLRMKVYSERIGFGLSMKSARCPHLPGDADVCPGNAAHCPFCRTPDACARSGGTTFTISFMKGRGAQAGSGDPTAAG